MKSNFIKNRRQIFTILSWMTFQLCYLVSIGQDQPANSLASDSTDRMQVEIINTDILNFEKRGEQAVKKLIGNVHMIQDSTVFFCDSAYHFETDNRIEAYNNVKVIMSDSVQLEGDKLEYDMNTRIAEIYDNITLTNGETQLFTDRLTYYREESFGYYSEGGTLKDTAIPSVRSMDITIRIGKRPFLKRRLSWSTLNMCWKQIPWDIIQKRGLPLSSPLPSSRVKRRNSNQPRLLRYIE